MSWVDIDVDAILRETDRAFLVRSRGESFWLPKSQVSAPEVYEAGDAGLEMRVSLWIARQKGIV